MIKSYRDRETETLAQGRRVPRWQSFEKVAARKLAMLDQARQLSDLRGAGSSLEALRGDRAGQHAIRINDQWRLCFVWRGGDAYDVEITDYH